MKLNLIKYRLHFILLSIFLLIHLKNTEAQFLLSKDIAQTQLRNNNELKNPNFIHSFFHSKKLGDEIFISFKMGYHFPFGQNDVDGIPGGLVFNGSTEALLGSNWYGGVDLEYWNSTTQVLIPGNLYQSEYINSAIIFSFSLKVRKNFGPMNFGLGGFLGNCSMKSSSSIGENNHNFLNLSFLLGMDFYVSKYLAISSQVEYKSLTRIEDTKKSFFLFTIGPSIILN